MIALAAALGMAFTLCVLAISVWLRVHTSMDPAGVSVSLLPRGIAETLRRVHRVAAAGAGLMLVTLIVIAFRHASGGVRRLPLVIAIVATGVLAWIGPMTPGYRHAWITVANVAASLVLVAAFRSTYTTNAPVPGDIHAKAYSLVRVTLVLALLQSTTGAAASAASLQREATKDPLHVAFGFVVLALCVVVASRARAWRSTSRVTLSLAVGIQLLSGLWVAAMGEARAPAVAWVHALSAGAIVLILAECAVQSVVKSPIPLPNRACAECSKGMHGPQGHRLLGLLGPPEDINGNDATFRCASCGTYWVRLTTT